VKTMLMLCLLLLASCASRPPAPSEPSTAYRAIKLPEGQTVKTAEMSEPDDETFRRIIISTADLRLETENPDSVHSRTVEVALDCGGYVLNSTPDQTSIRLPATEFHEALTEIEGLGAVVDKKISGNDITEKYRDLEIRLANALKTRGRYLKLLDEANNLQEIFRVEKELERMNHEIETLKGQINRLSHLTRYSTITVNTRQKTRSGPVGYALESVYKGVKWLFVRK